MSAIQRWLAPKIGRRLTLWTALLAISGALAVGSISYVYTRMLLVHSIEDQLGAEARLAAQAIAFSLNTVDRDIASLAGNSLVANGLVDSSGRSAYLTPFLNDYQLSVPGSYSLALTDFQGEVIAARAGAKVSYLKQPWVREVVDRAQPRIELRQSAATTTLLFAQPVVYPATDQPEGMLVVELDLRELFAISTPMLATVPYKRLYGQIKGQRQSLTDTGEPTSAADMLSASVPIQLAGALKSLALELELSRSDAEFSGALQRMALGYVIVALVTAIAAVVIARAMAARLTKPLADLSRAASSITEGVIDLTLPPLGQDEVGQLGEALTAMVTRLRRGRDQLEQLVQERTLKLNHSEARMRAVLENVPEGIVTFERGGRILSCNRAAEAIFGYHADEMRQTELPALLATPNAVPLDAWLATDSATPASGAASQWRELEGRRKSGEVFPLEFAISAVRLTEGTIYTGILRDITERKRAQAEVERARDAAERASNAKSDFLSSMSHELRTPMNAILGFAQLMAFDRSLPETHRSHLSKIQQAGEHLLSLINDVLDFSRIEAGHIHLALETVAAAELLRECRSLVQPLATRRGVHLDVREPTATSFAVRADRTRLRQALLNLLSNAIKYNRDGGSVLLYCSNDAPGMIRFIVADTGHGISPEKQQALFTPFNRLGAERGDIEGTGIGLVITKRLIELMDGRIGLHSEVGKGSTFWLDLPAARALPAVGGNAPAPSAAAGTRLGQPERYTLLYIEDNRANLELVKALVAGYWPNATLLTAPSAELGLELAATQSFDLVLLDINLPGMNGYQALAKLRQLPSCAATPIVALTANAATADIERDTSAGFDAYVTKPIDLSSFLQTLEAVLVRSRRPEAEPVPAPGAPVLIVDDEVLNRELLLGVLTALGYSTVQASDGVEALQQIRQHSPAVVLLDCEMPRMDGFQTAEAIRALPGHAHTPWIIAVTGHSEADVRAPAEAAGINDYLAKPIDVDALRRALARAGQPPAHESAAATATLEREHADFPTGQSPR